MMVLLTLGAKRIKNKVIRLPASEGKATFCRLNVKLKPWSPWNPPSMITAEPQCVTVGAAVHPSTNTPLPSI